MAIRQHTLPTPYTVGPVHCYSAELAGELVLFDTGPPTAAAREGLAGAVDLRRVRHVFVTHCHVDHYGLLDWLGTDTEAQLWIPARDAQRLYRHQEWLERLGELLAAVGFGPDFIDPFRRNFDDGEILPPFPREPQVIEESDVPQRLGLEILPCPGHSQSDLVYCGEDWAVTGDVLLRGIFQAPLLDVDLVGGGRFRNYDAYCASLTNLALLRGRRVLPGHREEIEGVDAGILFYVGKLLERAGRLRDLEEENLPRLVEMLFGDTLTKPFHIFIKASEIIFMHDFLQDPRRLREALEAIDLFTPVAVAYRNATA